LKAQHQDHPLLITEKGIATIQDDLTLRLEKWRDLQAIHMPKIKPLLLTQEPSELEDENLLLPSHFSDHDRAKLSLEELAEEEAKAREGQTHNCILQLRRVMKTISAMHKLKKKNSHGQRQCIRDRKQLDSLELTRDQILAIYSASRCALVSLRADDKDLAEQYPPLALADLYRKSTLEKRQRGDTHRADGGLWVATASQHLTIPTSTLPLALPSTASSSSHTSEAGIRDLEHSDDNQTVELGKLWSPVIGLSHTELEDWEHEGKLLPLNNQQNNLTPSTKRTKSSGTVRGRRCTDG
jgi:hypothetical protein